MSFTQAIARQQDAIFDRLGEDADWDGVGVVRVRRREADEDLHFDRGAIVETGHTIKVRKSQVDAPAIGQVVQILDDNGDPLPDAMFEVSGEPKLDRRRVWTCPVVPITA
jgi:hypothetical protein